MKNILITCLMVVILGTASCDYVKNYFKPHLELSGANPYQLNITEFTWGFGMTSVGQFNGDFDKLDEKVYDLLKGKTGICQVFLEKGSIDKYGKTNGTMQYIGDISIDDLNKFQDWKYWQKDAGIRTLIYHSLVNPPSDSVRTEIIPTSPVPQSVDSTKSTTDNNGSSVAGSGEQPKSYLFGIEELYPTEAKPSTLENNRFVINATIGEVDFNTGVFRLTTIDEDHLTLQFYPAYMSAAVLERLSLVLRPGNIIKCIGVKVNDNTYDLLAAKITPTL